MIQMEDYSRRPFSITAVQITEENLEEIAALISASVTTTPHTRFIDVNPSIIQGIGVIKPGWWITLMEGSYRAYTNDVFHRLFKADVPHVDRIDVDVRFDAQV